MKAALGIRVLGLCVTLALPAVAEVHLVENALTNTAPVVVSGEYRLTGAGGVQMPALALDAGAQFVLDPVRTPVLITGESAPTFAAGAKIALDAAYANYTKGRFVLLTWLGTAQAVLPEGLFDVASAAGVSPTLTQETYTAQKATSTTYITYTRLVLDLNPAAVKPQVKIMPLGDSITESSSQVGFGNPNYRIFLMQKLAARGYAPESMGFRHSNNQNAAAIYQDDSYSWHGGISGIRLNPKGDPNNRGGYREGLDTLLEATGVPDIILYFIGANDDGSDMDEMFESWTNSVVRLAQMRPTTKIISVAVMKQSGTWRKNFHDRISAAIADNVMGLPPNQLYFVNPDIGFPHSDARYTQTPNNQHPSWMGHDLTSSTFADKIEEVLQTPPVKTADGTADAVYTPNSNTGVAANVDPAYTRGFQRLWAIDALDVNTNGAKKLVKGGTMRYSYEKPALDPTAQYVKVGYYLELRHKFTGHVRWVWADMNTWGEGTPETFSFPLAYRQQRKVSALHVLSNDSGIKTVAADDDSVEGWLQFANCGYVTNVSGLAEAPAKWFPYDWNITLDDARAYGLMQIYRLAPTGPRPHLPAELLLAYNRWEGDGTHEIGIGNCSMHNFINYMGSNSTTYDRFNLTSYDLANLEIWAMPSQSRTGDTLTWCGKAGGGDGATFSVAANWVNESGAAQAPQSGDRLLFNETATLTSAIDLGSAGYTFYVGSGLKVKFNGKISGTGLLVKDGSGELFLENGANDYSGGSLIKQGILETDISSAKGVPFGTGDIEIRRATNTKCYLQTYHVNVTNNILITGPYSSTSYQSLDFCQETTYSGSLTCDSDVVMHSHFQNIGKYSDLAGVYNLHGHTLRMTFRNADARNGDMRLSGTFDCSYEKRASRDCLYTSGKFVDSEASYIIRGGTNYLDAGTSIACTNVVLDGSTYPAGFYFSTASAFSDQTTLNLAGSTKLHICSGLYASVKGVVINGEALLPGTYTAENLPALITGAGTLLVSASYTWTGAVSKAWNNPANWSPEGVPGSGDHVFFRAADTLSKNLSETVDIGEKGLVIHNLGGDIQLYGSFTGSGVLTLLGNKRLFLCRPNAHTGGTIVSCELWQYAEGTMGTGPVEIRRTGGTGVSCIPCVTWSTAEENDITVTGPYGGSSERTFQFGNSSGIGGTITATDDVRFFGRFVSVEAGGNINCTLNAHGHTAYFLNQMNSVCAHQTLGGRFDANITTEATVRGCWIRVTGSFVDREASYTINGCTNIIESTAQIACTNIVVNDAAQKDAYLWFKADNVFPVPPALSIANGGKVRVDQGLTVHLNQLTINGVELGKGAYTALTHPDVIEGPGCLRVGLVGFKVFLR